MSDFFSKLLDDSLGSEQYKIERLAYHQQTENLIVALDLCVFMHPAELQKLKVRLLECGLFKNVDLAFRYGFIKAMSEVEGIKMVYPALVHLVMQGSPSLGAWMNNSHYAIKEGTLTIGVSDDMILQTFAEKRVAFQLAAYIKELGLVSSTGEDIKVVFELDLSSGNTLVEQLSDEKDKQINSLIETISKGGDGASSGSSRPTSAGAKKAEGGFGGGFKGGNGGGGGFKRESTKKDKDERVIYRNLIKSSPVPMREVTDEECQYCVEGKLFEKELRDLKTGKGLISFALTDFNYSVGIKLFAKEEEKKEIFEALGDGKWFKVEGILRYDTYEKEHALYATSINISPGRPERADNAEVKRVELHMHTTMSEMDGMNSAKSLVKRAIKWGHPAVAITDHGVLQAFPEAMETSGKDIKVLYGVEGYMVNDSAQILEHTNTLGLDQEFVVFDIETTGFYARKDKITEIGAIRIRNNEIVDSFSALVNPERLIPTEVVELTGITDDMVRNEPTIDQVLPRFMEFVNGAVLVAHNAKFDTSFIFSSCDDLGIPYSPIVVDTLALSRHLLKDLKKHKLNIVAKYLDIKLEGHHRAVNDAEATARIFLKFLIMLKEMNIETLEDINKLSADTELKNMDAYHIVILVKNYAGLKDLYKMVSRSNMEYFFKRPRLPKSLIAEFRENLIIGSACEAGELFKAVVAGKSDDELESIAEFYDYLEIQPVGNNQFMIEKGMAKDRKELQAFNEKIVELGDRMGKMVCATCDVHFLDPQDEIYRRILQAGQGYSDAENQPPLYFRTTDEMLDEFAYLGREKAYEVVVTNTNKIADQMDTIKPIPDETYPPIIDGADDDLRNMCNAKAERIYGSPVPEIVRYRLDRELNSIISNGYAVMYIIAQKLVTKSLEDGYLVGSRGSVGSSFAATMCDITEVNPLPPHYVCDSCKYSYFFEDGSIGNGADLPDKACPECGENMIKDGHDIPFETFLGFEGDKEPDIDLNFAGVYQANAHKYTEVLFGTGYVFKAGTIGTIADKTAYGYVRKYFEERGKTVNAKEINRLTQGCTGVKRTSGQHPGGIMVVPNYKEIYDFCPIQYPANDGSSGVITTHFDYHSISGRILKLDILGHDVPTIIKHLEEMTGVNGTKIPLDDKETVKIFTSLETLKMVDPEFKCETGSLGIPEFGTKFVRQMLVDTQPSTFAELVRISGLSHGTDVWINNAQDLVRKGTAKLKDVISTRDDIMTYLIYQGLPPKESFNIMERVRKGKGLTDQNVELMKSFGVPEWYIWSCNAIKYMFPKAHAAAYVMMSFRIAWFKVHKPLAFYAAYYTSKVEDFDAHLVSQGVQAIRRRRRELDMSDVKLSKKEQDLQSMLEITDEMYSRGIEIHKVDLYKSEADKFTIVDGKLLPPLRSLQGVGEAAAINIVEARKEKPFISIQDLKARGKASKTVIEALDTHGCLKELPENNQLTLFAMGLG